MEWQIGDTEELGLGQRCLTGPWARVTRSGPVKESPSGFAGQKQPFSERNGRLRHRLDKTLLDSSDEPSDTLTVAVSLTIFNDYFFILLAF